MTVFGGDGSDVLLTQRDAAPAIELTLDGGAGADELGGEAAFLRGGDGDDFVDVAARTTARSISAPATTASGGSR